MTLHTLEMLPRGETGWTSGKLEFGRTTTVLLGPNGAGKTPVLQALFYALGQRAAIPPLVQDKCAAVRVEIDADGERFQLERRLTGSGVDASVVGSSGALTTFEDEKSLSEWVLPRLGLPLRSLTASAGGGQVAPYMSVVGPMFLVDQDNGWKSTYAPVAQFVRDQREEVVRWMLDLPVKHRPVDKSEYEKARTKLAGIQEEIRFKRQGLEALKRDFGEDRERDAVERLTERRTHLERQIGRAQSVIETLAQTESALDVRLREAAQNRDEISRRLGNAKRRKAQLVEVQAEVGAELGALEQNEVASEAFRALCGNDACEFFRRPEESYGRRVLYLKDQLKDFESSAGETERDLATLQAQLEAAEGSVKDASDARRQAIEKAGGGDVVGVVEAASRELADVHVRLDRLDRLAKEQARLEVMIDREARANDDVAALRPTGIRRDASRVLDARANLAAFTKEWLRTLRTPNLQADVIFDEELRLVVDGERFSSTASPSGSTRARLVLAYHAALVEASLQMKGFHPRLLVLDAPHQQEMNADDLRAFIVRFHALSAKLEVPVQLVFSASDPAVVPTDCVERLWEPHFAAPDGPRYLGSVAPPDPPPAKAKDK